MPLEKRGETKERDSFRNREVCVCLCAVPPVTTDYRHAPQMASASRLFTATTAENNGQRWPLLLLLRSLSLLTARVSVKWERVSGTMAARQRARLPPTRMLNRGARGPCHRGNNSTGGEGERGCGNRAPTATGDGEVQPGWPEFRFELVGFSAFNGGHITSKNIQKSICRPEDEDGKKKKKRNTSKADSASVFPLSCVHLFRLIIYY